MKIIAKALVFFFVLATCAVTIASSVSIEVDSDSITGSADGAPMGQVLKLLNEKIGCDVYIDSALAETPVSFTIEEKLTPEKAIQRIVHPHSYAMVFGTEGRGSQPKIQEIWIFRQGAQHSAHFVPLGKEDPDFDTSSPVEEDKPRSAASLSALSVPDQRTEGKALVRRDLQVGKSAFGTPVLKGKDKAKGPDYRPSPHQMRLAYLKYQWAKRQEERRIAEVTIRQAQLNAERNRDVYLSKRNQELKNQILEMKQK